VSQQLGDFPEKRSFARLFSQHCINIGSTNDVSLGGTSCLSNGQPSSVLWLPLRISHHTKICELNHDQDSDNNCIRSYSSQFQLNCNHIKQHLQYITNCFNLHWSGLPGSWCGRRLCPLCTLSTGKLADKQTDPRW